MTEVETRQHWDGMYPQHPCKGCGKPLNADGGHPAELYAGTYTALCYGCERKAPFVVREFLDGGATVSHPPSCPSWRRDREEFYWYPDCTVCRMGAVWVSRSLSEGGGYNTHCDTCSKRHYAYVEERRRCKLQGLTPYEQLAAQFEEERQRNSQGAKQRITKYFTREWKELYSARAEDYAWLIVMVINSVFMDTEDQMLSDLEKRIGNALQRIEAAPETLMLEQKRLAAIQAAYADLCQALPAQHAAKRGKTRVLI